MGSDETPAHQMPARSITLEVLAERLSNFQDDFREHRRDWKKFVAHQQEQESDHAIAVERCSTHGTRLDAVEKKIAEQPVVGSDKLTFWTALAALGSGIGAWLTSFFGGNHP